MTSLFVAALLSASLVPPNAVAAQLPTKPCPVELFLARDGRLFDGESAHLQRRSLPTLDSQLTVGCYPEGGPSPVSAVTLHLAPHAPQPRVDQLLATLARHGWTRSRIAILPWTNNQ